MKVRGYRYGAIGFVYLFISIYSFWLFGGEINFITQALKAEKIEEAIAAILSAPLFGFMISTLTPSEFIRKRLKENPKNAPSQGYLALVSRRFTKNGFNESGIEYIGNIYSIKDQKKLNVAHQALFREKVSDEVLGYTLRRNDVFFMQLNCICAIILGFTMGAIFEVLKDNKIERQFDLEKGWPLIVIIAYCFIAYTHATKEVCKAQMFEEAYVFKRYKFE